MTSPANAVSNPWFQYLSFRDKPFGEQVFYWLHWREDGKSKLIQVIFNFAQAKLITRFFLKAALMNEPPAPVDLPNLKLVCKDDLVTVTASNPDQSQSITFDRNVYMMMCCALAMSGMAIPQVGGDFALFSDLERHPLYRDLAARSALQEARDLPAFHVLQEHPALQGLAQRALEAVEA